MEIVARVMPTLERKTAEKVPGKMGRERRKFASERGFFRAASARGPGRAGVKSDVLGR